MLTRSGLPVVREDGEVGNLDDSQARLMDGLKQVRNKNGGFVWKEKRPGRCIFCNRKKCVREPNRELMDLVAWRFNSIYLSCEIYSCRGKKFRGSLFARSVWKRNAKFRSIIARGRPVRCPNCGSDKLRQPIGEGRRHSPKKAEHDTYECQTCGFIGENQETRYHDLDRFMDRMMTAVEEALDDSLHHRNGKNVRIK